MSNNVTIGLLWLKSILDQNEVPYQIVGGMAATIHGGTRPVADIDLYISKVNVGSVLPSVRKYISKPLGHYVEYGWDLEYFQLIYQGQKIEIGLSPGTKLYDKKSDEWYSLVIDYRQSVMGSYEGVEVPVMQIPELITYKSILDREVDRIDIMELNQISARKSSM